MRFPTSLVMLAASAAALAIWQSTTIVHGAPASTAWNRAAAARYLDSREVWWQQWPAAKRDHGTICISCHTVVPYALARPLLSQDLAEGTAAPEKVLLDNIEQRVSHWSDMVPFYSDAEQGAGKTAQSHSTEAVLNAVILASYDKRAGQLRPVTRTALDAAWALQLETGENAGGWLWQDFHLAPWESSDSAYQGAAMLMLEAGTAPAIFATTPADRCHLQLLAKYLRAHYAAQPALNQLYVLWAAADAAGLLNASERGELLRKIEALQQTDGGWRLSSLEVRERADKTPQASVSDGYATALVALALEASGGPAQKASLGRGLAWLEQHQSADGTWYSSSINKERNPATNVGRFMSDAATGYAVLALERSSQVGVRSSR